MAPCEHCLRAHEHRFPDRFRRSHPVPGAGPARAAFTRRGHCRLDPRRGHPRPRTAGTGAPARRASATPPRPTAADLVRRVRARARDQGVVEAFMRQYDLGSEEGVLLMCVAEALLRIPDQDTADKLIRDKLGDADWKRHMGQSDSVLVNASTWGLMLTGQLVDLADDTKRDVHGAFQRLVGRVGEPVIRLAVRQAMKIMGHQFVHGPHHRRGAGALAARATTRELPLFLRHAGRRRADHEGRAALPARPTATRSTRSARQRRTVGRADACSPRPASRSSCRRCTRATSTPSARACWPSWRRACWNWRNWPRQYGIGFTIDAEETDRLELSLDVIVAVLARRVAATAGTASASSCRPTRSARRS